MVHVLHVVVIFQEVDELFHVLDIGGVSQGDVVLGDHLHLGGKSSVFTETQELFYYVYFLLRPKISHILRLYVTA